jgi:diguanylate cyclase (GGDEF)-like protein
VSFILAALVPIVLFGWLSFRQVSEQLREQTAKSLHKNSKNYAMGLIERFHLANNTLDLVATKVDKSDQGFRLIELNRDQSAADQFSSLVVLNPKDEKNQVVDKTGLIPRLSNEDMKEILLGTTLIKPVASAEPGGTSRLWIVISLIKNRSDAGVLMGELTAEHLWESENTGPNTLWVISDSDHLLFASEPSSKLPPEIRTQILHSNSGQFSWKNNDIDYVGAYWKIPMKGMFSTPDMSIVLAQPESLAFEAIQQFGKIYPPVIALVILVIAFFITRLIAKYLSPLEQLKAATVKIAGGDFNAQVNINSRDEFEALAVSFNDMTRRIRSQFDILSAMAEIDRNILSSLNAENIVETTLSRLPSILFCDLISIAKVDPETYHVSDIHTRVNGHDTEITKKPIKLGLQDILDLLDKQNSVLETDFNGKLSAYLETFSAKGNWRYLLIPVVVNGTLSSIICLGYQFPNVMTSESRNAARNFGDRLAVALSNAAWEEKLYKQAHYDSLTGLPNRLVLNDRLMQELTRARRDDTQLAVIFADLDRFKTVNDSLGHAAGDELLIQVSKIFVNCIRATDLVVRIGGDEFVIVITELYNHINPMLLVRTTAEKILNSLNQTLLIADHPMTFSASLGIAVFPTDADNVQDLLKNADAAMYHAKNEGRANFRFYSPYLNAAALENIKLEQALRGAIAKGELKVFYQPKVDLNRRIVGAEALVRWQHNELGMVSPAKFIPLAEQTGLIVEIGHWVFEQTCLWVKYCYDQGFEPGRISVNLSGIEFKRPDLVEKFAETLDKIGVDPRYIELEITESVAVGDINNCIQRMNELKSLGLTLSMDDFGTGFSSLSYLKNLPLDVLKIDQSFVRHLELTESDQAIVWAILALANGLGMETVAEGIETEAQFELLKGHQCGLFQGFLFSRPIPAEDFLRLLASGYL